MSFKEVFVSHAFAAVYLQFVTARGVLRERVRRGGAAGRTSLYGFSWTPSFHVTPLQSYDFKTVTPAGAQFYSVDVLLEYVRSACL